MKKQLIIALALTLVVVAFAASPASADTEPHGSYTATTESCAGCHRAHTAVGDKLLKATSIYELCKSCHGPTGSGANNAVWDGKQLGTNEPLKGGGFDQTYMNTALSGSVPAAAGASSKHNVNGMTNYAVGTMWGNGATLNSGAGPSNITIECTSCHNPHGKAGSGGVETYRILRGTPTGSGATTPVNVPDDATKVYVVSDANHKYYGQQYPEGAVVNGKIAVLSDWCATCHTRLHASSDSDSGDTIYGFRHKTNGSSVENNFGTPVHDPAGYPACLTCHVAHGSSATMGGYAATVPVPGGVTAMGSALLRADNRGVCQQCHNK